MALNSVVLPAPLGPMMARRWPRGTVRLIPSTARRASNATTTSVSVRIGSDTIVSGGVLSGESAIGSPDSATMMRGTRRQWPRPAGNVSSCLLDALEGPRIGWLLHVGLRVVFPELRHVGVAGGRHVPELAVGSLHDLADVNIVDRVAVGVELDGLAERRAVKLRLQHGVDEGLAVLDLAAHLLQGSVDPHHAGIHREAVERGDLAVL